MNNETKDSCHEVPSCAQSDAHFIWPLGKDTTPDEMNISYGPRIDADRWDFHDGIDLPAPVGTPVHAMADGLVYRAGPADKTGPGQGFGSTHVLLQVCDPTDGQNDLFLVYLHLDSIAEGVIPGAQVCQGDVIGAVGQEDATPIPIFISSSGKANPKKDTLRVNANLFQTDLCRNPGSMDGFELTIPYDYAQDRPWHWIPVSRRV